MVPEANLGSNSVAARCGECTSILSKTVPYSFLDWTILAHAVPVTVAGWATSRFDVMPTHLSKWLEATGEDANLASYDNHHNLVGHIQNLFKLLLSVTPSTHHQSLDAELLLITRISAATRPKGSKIEDWRFYRGFHWRLVSLHFSRLFTSIWATQLVRASFDTLFALLTEIHIFNYIHWDRDSIHFAGLRLRYCLILFMYTLQLRTCFTADEAEALNTIYLHKILTHSVWCFRNYNLAATSCEQGEGMISVVNSILPHTSGKEETR